VDVAEAVVALEEFSGPDLTSTLSQIEAALAGCGGDQCDLLLVERGARPDALAAAGLMKQLVGQINVVIHALGILLCLPQLLQTGEVVESVSLGAGNTGKPFDLITNRRLAEFKFIAWQGGPESIRQNSVFKDFYYLAEADSPKSKHLYVLGTGLPLKFLKGGRSLDSVLSKNVTFKNDFRAKYPDYSVVRDYYLPRKDRVLVEDVSPMVPGLLGELET
jgi:hypothetical protein